MTFFFWFGIVFSLGAAVLPFIFHNAPNAEEYMFPKIFIYFPSLFLTEIGLICGCRDIAANKLVRSFPIAKELYTKSVPLFSAILTVGVSVVCVGAYFIFLGITGAEAEQFADTLIIGAVILAPQLIMSSFLAIIPGGGALGVYVAFLPVILISVIGENTVMRRGFGVSVPAAALIFAVSVAVSAAVMFFLAGWNYRRSNVRINNALMNCETK